MKIQRSTLALVLLATLVSTGYFIYQAVVIPHQEKADQKTKALFDFKEDQVQRLSIETANQTLLIFERRSDQKPTPWQMLKPENSLASDSSIAFLLNLLATESSTSTVTVSRDRLREFGLETPLVTIGITLKDRTIHQMLLGSPDFSGSSLYALVDPDPKSKEVSVRMVSNQFQSGTSRSLAEWKYTPPPPAPSPSSSPGVSAPGATLPPTTLPTPQTPNPSPTATLQPTTTPQPTATP